MKTLLKIDLIILIVIGFVFADSLTNISYHNKYFGLSIIKPSNWTSDESPNEFANIQKNDTRLDFGSYSSKAVIDFRKHDASSIPSIRIHVKSISKEYSKQKPINIAYSMYQQSKQTDFADSGLVFTKPEESKLANGLNVAVLKSLKGNEKNMITIAINTFFIYQIYVSYFKDDELVKAEVREILKTIIINKK